MPSMVDYLFKIGHTAVLSLLGATMVIPSAAAADLNLAQYHGKVIYLDFWASWCVPCRESFPWLGDLVRKYASKQFVVIGVNLDQDAKSAEKFLRDTPAQFPVIYDPDGKLATDYKIVGMPSSVLIDRNGQVRFQHTGFLAKKKDEYEDQLRTLISEAGH